MTEKHDLSLSRRKLLGSAGVIGVTSAGAGLGTTAYLSDTESFEGNNVTAGELDLFVHYEFTADQGGVEGDNLGDPTSGRVQGNVNIDGEDAASVGYDLVDVKPGDSGGMEFCFSIVDNPAYLWAGATVTANNENGYTEPEPDTAGGGDTNDPGDETGDGELADAVVATLSYYQNGESTAEILSGTLGEVLSKLESGIALDGDGNESAIVGEQTPSMVVKTLHNPLMIRVFTSGGRSRQKSGTKFRPTGSPST